MHKWFLVALAAVAFAVLLLVPRGAMASRFAANNLCDNPQYVCIQVPKGETWQTLFPDEQFRGLVMRINRMNVQLHSGEVIAIPSDMQKTSLLDYSPLPATVAAANGKTVIVVPKKLAWGAYDESGRLVNWGPISPGKDWCPDVGSACHTATGVFNVYREGSASCASTKFPVPDGGAPMPYCMFFHDGYALHGSSTVPGYADSHGCVRLFVDDAQWLNQNFVEKGTTVIVRSYTDSA